MAVLTAAARKAAPKSQVGIPKPPGPKGGVRSKYFMPDAEHAVIAKGRAKQMLNAGKLSRSAYEAIIAKANRRIVQLSGG
jgi:hypothetical protein